MVKIALRRVGMIVVFGLLASAASVTAHAAAPPIILLSGAAAPQTVALADRALNVELVSGGADNPVGHI